MMTITSQTFPRGFNSNRILGYEDGNVPASTWMARWQSGDAEDCKSLYAGSIPARASKFLLIYISILCAKSALFLAFFASDLIQGQSPDNKLLPSNTICAVAHAGPSLGMKTLIATLDRIFTPYGSG
jgi:hypothetical protein